MQDEAHIVGPRRPVQVPAPTAAIDERMESASRALAQARYFEAERLCAAALTAAHRLHDYERMARIVLPLLEARRQKRQRALDAGVRSVLSAMPRGRALRTGCYLLCPPLIGRDGRRLREAADWRQVPVLVLAREPAAADGRWPIVAVGKVRGVSALIVRTRVDPPAPAPPPEAWFVAASEALGDEAISRVRAEDPPAWRVDDLLELLDAVPEHEKLHQRLEEACREAIGRPAPAHPRPRGAADDPHCF